MSVNKTGNKLKIIFNMLELLFFNLYISLSSSGKYQCPLEKVMSEGYE